MAKRNQTKSAKAAKPKKATAKKMDPVVHFEMPSEDNKRMAKFYTQAFGWQTKQLGEEMRNYVLVTTSDVDKNGRPKDAGMINGGFYPRNTEMPAQFPSLVIAVDDIRNSMKKVTKAGGKVIGDPMEIPGFGLYVSFFDTEGNRMSIMQPSLDRK